MDLEKLFKIQAELDKRIVEKHGLQNEDLLDKKILALQVELGELANEWRGFKFWSEDRESRTEHECDICEGEGSITLLTESINDGEGEKITFFDCKYCNGDGYLDKNPLLEEYVDCLHFILSIGLEINKTSENNFVGIRYPDSTNGIINKDDVVSTFSHVFKNTWNVHSDYRFLVNEFMYLGELLGFTWEQIETAYREKNKINHERQESGY